MKQQIIRLIFLLTFGFAQQPGLIARDAPIQRAEPVACKTEMLNQFCTKSFDAFKKHKADKDLTMLLPGNWKNREGEARYVWGSNGCIFGTNLYEDIGYGQKFYVDGFYEIYGAYFWFGFADGETGDVVFTIWDWDDDQGKPGNVLETKTVPLKDIEASLTFEPDPDHSHGPQPGAFFVEFDEPVLLVDDYVIGVDFSDLNEFEEGEYWLGNYSSLMGDGGNLTMAWLWEIYGWYSIESVGFSTDIAVFPLVDVTGLNIRTLTLLVDQEAGGTVEGYGEYAGGSVIAISADPNMPEYGFNHWEDEDGNIVSQQNPYIFIMPAEDIILTAVFKEVDFAGGSGSEADPWLIETVENLNCVRYFCGEDHHDKYFKQIENINLDVKPYNENEGWLPICYSYDHSFRGNYNGNGHTINGLYINRPEDDLQGLFGYAYEAYVSDLGLTNIDVNGQDFVGGLIGYSFNYTTVKNSYSSGNVSGRNRVGGLIGFNRRYSNIENSFSDTNISGKYRVGGLVGAHRFNSTIINSYATGSVFGEEKVGGLAGWVDNSSILNSYSTGYIDSEFVENIGGLIGGGQNIETTSAYWNTETSRQAGSAGGEGRITQEMVSSETFGNWDFYAIWSIEEEEAYPYLQWQEVPGEHNYPPDFYMLTLIADPEEGGYLDGAGELFVGEEVKVLAYPNPGYYFLYWKDEDDNIISLENEFIYTMEEEDIAFYAFFDMYEPSDKMRLIFNTGLGEGKTVTLPLFGKVDVIVDWGDGNQEAFNSEGTKNHTYDVEDIYTVYISGELSQFGKGYLVYDNAEKLVKVTSFGDIGLTSLSGAFNGAANLLEVPAKLPSTVSDLSYMFTGALSFNQDIGDWHVGNVKNMKLMFSNAMLFNQHIGSWNISNVSNMQGMFYGALSFNQNISNWDVSNVENFEFFLLDSELSVKHYNSLLIDWSYLNLNEGVDFHGGNSQYNLGVPSDRRDYIIEQFNWNIEDGGDTGEDFDLFRLELKKNPENAAIIDGGGFYDQGEVIKITAIANEGFEFIHWANAGNEVVSVEADFYYTMPAEDVTLTANFDTDFSILSLYADPEEGGSVFGGGGYEEGTEVMITADAGEGWVFVKWTGDTEYVDDNGAESTTVSIPAEDIAIIANFKKIYFLTLRPEPIEGGVVKSAGEYIEGEEVTVNAIANEGFGFFEWVDAGNEMVSDKAEFVYTMPDDDVKLIANFELIKSDIVFNIVDKESNSIISDAVITFDNVTNDPGVCDFKDVLPGTYDYEVKAEKYFYEKGFLTVADEDINKTVGMRRFGPNMMIAHDVLALPARQITIDVEVLNANDIVAFQMDFKLPEGFEKVEESAVLSERATDHFLITQVSGDLITIVSYSLHNTPYKGSSGVIASFDLTSPDKAGEWLLVPENVILAASPAQNIFTGAFGSVITLTTETTVNRYEAVEVKVFPNPARNKFTIESNEIIKQIRLIDISGQVVKDKFANELSYNVNVHDLRPGMYFLQIFTKDGGVTERVQVKR